MAENCLSTNNKAANTADWFPLVGIFSGFYHLGYGCKKLNSLEKQKVQESTIDKFQEVEAPVTSKNLKDRKITRLSAEQDAMGHIRRALLLLLLPVIGGIFLMIYDLVTRCKAHKPKTIIIDETLPSYVPPASNKPNFSVEHEPKLSDKPSTPTTTTEPSNKNNTKELIKQVKESNYFGLDTSKNTLSQAFVDVIGKPEFPQIVDIILESTNYGDLHRNFFMQYLNLHESKDYDPAIAQKIIDHYDKKSKLQYFFPSDFDAKSTDLLCINAARQYLLIGIQSNSEAKAKQHIECVRYRSKALLEKAIASDFAAHLTVEQWQLTKKLVKPHEFLNETIFVEQHPDVEPAILAKFQNVRSSPAEVKKLLETLSKDDTQTIFDLKTIFSKMTADECQLYNESKHDCFGLKDTSAAKKAARYLSIMPSEYSKSSLLSIEKDAEFYKKALGKNYYGQTYFDELLKELPKDKKNEFEPLLMELKSKSEQSKIIAELHKIKSSNKLGDFLKDCKNTVYFKWVGETLTPDEIANAVTKNYLDIKEEYHTSNEKDDWLFKFMDQLSCDKLNALVTMLLKRDDLDYSFFQRLLTIAYILKDPQQKAVYDIICNTCQSISSKYHWMLSSLENYNQAHKRFALAFMDFATPALLFKRNPIICRTVITSSSSKAHKDWLATADSIMPKPLMESSNPVEEFKKIRGNTTAVQHFLGCLGDTISPAKLGHQLKLVADEMTVEEIKLYATMEENCFYLSKHTSFKDELLAALLPCFSPEKKIAFVNTTMLRKDLGLETFNFLVLAISKTCPDTVERKQLYMTVFNAIKEKGCCKMLGNITSWNSDGFGEQGPWIAAMRDAYLTLFTVCMQAPDPYAAFVPFYTMYAMVILSKEVETAFTGEELVKAKKLLLKCHNPYQAAKDEWEELKADPMKLKIMYSNLKTAQDYKVFCSKLDYKDFDQFLDPVNDILGVHDSISHGKGENKLAVFIANLGSHGMRLHFFKGMQKYPDLTDAFFAKYSNGSSYFLEFMKQYGPADRKVILENMSSALDKKYKDLIKAAETLS